MSYKSSLFSYQAVCQSLLSYSEVDLVGVCLSFCLYRILNQIGLALEWEHVNSVKLSDVKQDAVKQHE